MKIVRFFLFVHLKFVLRIGCCKDMNMSGGAFVDNSLSSLAKSLGDMISGKGKQGSIEGVARLLASESGKRVVASLLADGGERIKLAAEAAKNGDTSGIEGIIASVASSRDGAELLRSIGEDLKK